jgi:matrixin
MALPPSVSRPIAAATALAALLVPAAAARADHGEPFSNPTLTRYLKIAERHWAVAAPTCTAADGQPLGVHAVLYDEPDPSVVASAEQPGCRIWLDRDWWPRPPSERDCITIVHEWGHLLGYGHSSDPNSLMASYPTGGAPECAFFGHRATRARSDAARKRSAARRARAVSRDRRRRCAAERPERPLTHDAWSSRILKRAHADKHRGGRKAACKARR